EYATPGWVMEPRWGRRASPYLPRRGYLTQPGVAYSRTPGGTAGVTAPRPPHPARGADSRPPGGTTRGTAPRPPPPGARRGLAPPGRRGGCPGPAPPAAGRGSRPRAPCAPPPAGPRGPPWRWGFVVVPVVCPRRFSSCKGGRSGVITTATSTARRRTAPETR